MTIGTPGEVSCEILRDISFPCKVNGKVLTATLTHIEDHYFGFTYCVSFSDGYNAEIQEAKDGMDTIWTDLNNEEDNLRRPELGYLEAVKEDLTLFSPYQPLEDVCLIVMDMPGEKGVKVWALKTEESNDYDIHYRNKHQFTLERTEEGWHTHSINGSESDHEYVMNLSRLISAKIDETP